MSSNHDEGMMRFRSSSQVRVKIVALLAALAALWAFAAWVTVRDGLNLLFVNTLADDAGRSTEELVEALQQERRLSAVVLGQPDDDARHALADSRQHTDQVHQAWRDALDGRILAFAASDRTGQLASELAGHLDNLDQLRTSIDTGDVDRALAHAEYTRVVDTGFAIYRSLGSLDDLEIARQSLLLTSLTQARELISQQDALLAGALAAGQLTDAEITELTMLVGAQRQLYQQTAAELPDEDLALYQAAVASPAIMDLRQVEDTLLAQARAGAGPPVSAQQWDEVAGAGIAAMRDMELAAVDNLLQRATPVAVGVVVRLVLAGGLGLVALVAAIVVSITTARNLVRQLERLRDAARDLATNRLPRVVERLSAGQTVDVKAEAPPLQFGDDEIGQVGQAFNAVQQTAVQAAVQQAELRRGVRDVFLSLARRTQGLVHKQLGVLDTVERRVTDPDEMEDLFRIDHLATRMRRNAENLIVLSGANSGRGWRQPVPMIDVVRGALAEVEDYTRVNVQAVDTGAVEGRVVGDVIHLLAELIENAASFSPPYAPVTVSGQRVARGFVVEIEDRGLGMCQEELESVNEQLANPPDFSLADASRLGHYVVGKLAERHGIKVHLRTSPYGGIAAIVLIPGELITDEPDDPAHPAPPAPAAVTPAAASTAAVSPATVAPAASTAQPTDTDLRTPETAQRPARTPSGLPWRVRQASLPKQLRPEQSRAESTDDAGRDPETVRQMMQAYQRGTRLGRDDAEANGQTAPAPAAGDSREG